MKWLGGTLVFLAELAMYAGMFWWGYTTFDGFWGWLVGLSVPFFVSVIWSLSLSPKAPRPLPTPAKVTTRLVLHLAGIATAASALVGTAIAAKYPIDEPGVSQPPGMDADGTTLPPS